MSVDFRKNIQVLVIHGVPAGDDGGLRQHETIKANVVGQLAGMAMPFETDIFTYEDIDDEAAFAVKKALAALTGNSINGWIVEQAAAVAADPVSALLKGPAYELIKKRFKERVLASYARQEPLFIVAQGLGSLYAFDAVNDLMKLYCLFTWNERETWPVQGLITLGSPIALDIFGRDRRSLTDLVPAGQGVDDNSRLFPWINCWDPADPVVSGDLAGLPSGAGQFAAKFRTRAFELGWDVRTRTVITGPDRLAAHTSYWTNADVGFILRWMMARCRVRPHLAPAKLEGYRTVRTREGLEAMTCRD